MAEAETQNMTEGFVISKDGTRIAYQRYGTGPGLILVQGGMGTMYNYRELAVALAQNFTVYVPERRGRGQSPKTFTDDYSIEREVEDLKAVVDLSRAEFVFALSAGAIITLEAIKTIPSIKKVTLYEPPLFVKEPVPIKQMNKVISEISDKKYPEAFVDFFKLGKTGPKFFIYSPRFILLPLIKYMMKVELKNGTTGYLPIIDLVPTLRFDLNAILPVIQRVNKTEYSSISIPVLLLGGTKSPKYLKQALDFLKKNIKDSRCVTFKGLDHLGPWNKDVGGNPGLITQALNDFYTGLPLHI